NIPNNKKVDSLQKRIDRINNAILEKDLNALRRLAITGPGLVNNGLRRLCWLNHNIDVSQ
ncbi:8202_t:CDS:2, partial [Racocetra persica]